MAILTLISGLTLFVGAHLVPAWPALRARLVGALGEGPYKGAFSLAAAAGLVLATYGFGLVRAAGLPVLWTPPAWTSWVAIALMWPSTVMVVAAYLPGHIRRVLKHPMLTGVMLWAFVHLIANGDVAGTILFGTIFVWSVLDRISLGARIGNTGPRIADGGIKNDVAAMLVGTLVYLALGYVLHPAVIGVPVFGG